MIPIEKSSIATQIKRFFTEANSIIALVYIPVLTLGLLIFIFLLCYLIFKIIPLDNGEPFSFLSSDHKLNAKPESKLLLLIMLSGALGSFVHSAHSFVVYVGLGKFKLSWVWWYLMRPFIGMALAIIFYFVVMAGFISIETVVNVTPETDTVGVAALNSGIDTTAVPVANTETKSQQQTNAELHDVKRRVYILLAFSALVGMFSSKAIDKLGDIFDVMFQSKSTEAIYEKDSYKKPDAASDSDFFDQNALG